MITLYGARGSGSAAIEAALVLAAASYSVVEGATWAPTEGYEALKHVNPLGQVPTLVFEDGTPVTESVAILLCIAERFPQAALMPTDPMVRAQALRGLVYLAANCYAAIGVIDYPERWCSGGDEACVEAVRLGARHRLHALWSHFADIIVPSPWLAGPELGALDILASVVSRWSGARAHLRAERPHLADLLGKVDADPRLAPVFERHWPRAEQ